MSMFMEVYETSDKMCCCSWWTEASIFEVVKSWKRCCSLTTLSRALVKMAGKFLLTFKPPLKGFQTPIVFHTEDLLQQIILSLRTVFFQTLAIIERHPNKFNSSAVRPFGDSHMKIHRQFLAFNFNGKLSRERKCLCEKSIRTRWLMRQIHDNPKKNTARNSAYIHVYIHVCIHVTSARTCVWSPPDGKRVAPHPRDDFQIYKC